MTARPVGEWEGTIKAYEGMEAVSGIGEAAHYSSRMGMLVKPSGKPYFLHVIVMLGNDRALVEAAAKTAL